jgi:phosphate transport system substrate-binding protein
MFLDDQTSWYPMVVAVLALTVLGMEASASEPLRVYTVKNVADEVNQLGQTFSNNNPQTPVIVTGGVPEKGFAPFAAGHYDLLICPQGQCDSAQLSLEPGFRLTDTPVGSYGMAIVVSPSLPVSALTLVDARKLFTGEYTNWAQLDGPNEPVTVYTRELNAGTTVYVKGKLLGDAGFAAGAMAISLDKEILRQVARSPGSVGYVRVNRVAGTNVKVVELKKEANSPGVACSEENVRDRSYPLTVILAAHWNGLSKRTSAILSFVQFCRENQLGLK